MRRPRLYLALLLTLAALVSNSSPIYGAKVGWILGLEEGLTFKEAKEAMISHPSRAMDISSRGELVARLDLLAHNQADRFSNERGGELEQLKPAWLDCAHYDNAIEGKASIASFSICYATDRYQVLVLVGFEKRLLRGEVEALFKNGYKSESSGVYYDTFQGEIFRYVHIVESPIEELSFVAVYYNVSPIHNLNRHLKEQENEVSRRSTPK